MESMATLWPLMDSANHPPKNVPPAWGQHGEGHTLEYKVKPERNGNTSTLTLTGLMPIVQENFTRAYTVVDGENVVYVDSKLENLMGFDRPINWAEHATIQAPFR